MEYLFRLQASATVLTAGVSLFFLFRLWREAELHGVQEAIFGLWFVVALTIQLMVRTPSVWIAGLVAQFVLAIVLVLKEQMNNIY